MNKKLTLAFLGALSLLINVSGFAAAAAAAGSRRGLRIIRTAEGLAVPWANMQISSYRFKQPDGTMARAKISYPRGQTELMTCAAHNYVRAMNAILEHNPEFRVNINKYNSQGLTPLMVGVISEHADIVTTLLHHKADMELLDTRGLTALGIAVACRHISCINVLLDAGAQRTRRDLEEPLLALSVGVMNASVMRKVIDRLTPDQLRKQIPNALKLAIEYEASEDKAFFERMGLAMPMAEIKAELKQMIIALKVAEKRMARIDAAKVEVKVASVDAASPTSLASSSLSLSPAAPTDVAMPAAAAASIVSGPAIPVSTHHATPKLRDEVMPRMMQILIEQRRRELENLLMYQAELEQQVLDLQKANEPRLSSSQI